MHNERGCCVADERLAALVQLLIYSARVWWILDCFRFILWLEQSFWFDSKYNINTFVPCSGNEGYIYLT